MKHKNIMRLGTFAALVSFVVNTGALLFVLWLLYKLVTFATEGGFS